MEGFSRNYSDGDNGKDSLHLSEKPSWYLSKELIKDHSPSRTDGNHPEKEAELRESYCFFLQKLGEVLKVGPVTTATAMVLCHRFYTRQSHLKTDWHTIATASMFLACKVEDQPCWLRDVVIVAYPMIYKGDPSAHQRIKQREIYYMQKQLILDAEHLILLTIAFDLNVELPYRPLVSALKRIEISDEDMAKVAKVAWNLINDWIRSSLCLQYKPHYIAAVVSSC